MAAVSVSVATATATHNKFATFYASSYFQLHSWRLFKKFKQKKKKKKQSKKIFSPTILHD